MNAEKATDQRKIDRFPGYRLMYVRIVNVRCARKHATQYAEHGVQRLPRILHVHVHGIGFFSWCITFMSFLGLHKGCLTVMVMIMGGGKIQTSAAQERGMGRNAS